MLRNQPSVIACVTIQYECDRIIEEAEQLAAEYDCELHVLSVFHYFQQQRAKGSCEVRQGEPSPADCSRYSRRRTGQFFGSVQPNGA